MSAALRETPRWAISLWPAQSLCEKPRICLGLSPHQLNGDKATQSAIQLIASGDCLACELAIDRHERNCRRQDSMCPEQVTAAFPCCLAARPMEPRQCLRPAIAWPARDSPCRGWRALRSRHSACGGLHRQSVRPRPRSAARPCATTAARRPTWPAIAHAPGAAWPLKQRLPRWRPRRLQQALPPPPGASLQAWRQD